jgi:putative endonuclease
MNKQTKSAIALTGETLAAGFLENSGFKLICRNYHSAYGEIDIIALDDNELVFVEVKTRTGSTFRIAEDSVSLKKQQKLTLTAMKFLEERHDFGNMTCRFDVISILYCSQQDTYNIKHLKNAFLPVSPQNFS